jgi:DNA adenine methylase
MPNPFLKWAGGKRKLAALIASHIPGRDRLGTDSVRLVEPFLGSGAVFMGVDADTYLLCDTNEDLIRLYGFLSERGEAFVDRCRDLFVPSNDTPQAYVELRAEFNAIVGGGDMERRAALFVYLNRHCFNGLCRYSAKGHFNVPFNGNSGKPKPPPHFPDSEMRGFAHRASVRGARFEALDFRQAMARAVPGDVVYCDPPYVPHSLTASFDAYAKGGFSLGDHADLAELCRALAGRGIPVLLSNSDNSKTREMYRGALIYSLEVRRSISADGGKRNKAAELIAVFLPEGMEPCVPMPEPVPEPFPVPPDSLGDTSDALPDLPDLAEAA